MAAFPSTIGPTDSERLDIPLLETFVDESGTHAGAPIVCVACGSNKGDWLLALLASKRIGRDPLNANWLFVHDLP